MKMLKFVVKLKDLKFAPISNHMKFKIIILKKSSNYFCTDIYYNFNWLAYLDKKNSACFDQTIICN